MDSNDKAKEQLLKDIAQIKKEIGKLKLSESEHQKIERALRQDRNFYMDLANSHPAGIYRLRVFSNKYYDENKWCSSLDSPCAIEFFNDRFCELFRLDRQAIKSNPGIINDFVLEADKAEFARKNVEANLNMTPFIWEGRFDINREILWVHFESVPRQLENGDTMWTGIIYDITERIKKEQAIERQNQELQKINAEKDKFFSIIAHDLKNPFNSIVGFSELLAKQIDKTNFQLIEKYAEIILHSSYRAMDLLKNLMAWTQSQTGRLIFDPVYFNIVPIINETIGIFADIAEQKSITIEEKLTSMVLVFADKAMIGTILRNLISNALKFTAKGGKVIISLEKKQSEVIVKISDTGVGIPKGIIEKLFLINGNYSTRGTQNEDGTGLGLILCKEFIEKHDGKIWVESEPGIGSVFYFTIPYPTKAE